MSPNDYKLDNPVWHSLNETHQSYGIDYNEIKFYQPDYCPFGDFIDIQNTANPIADYAELTSHFYIFGEKPNIPNNLKLESELICLQLIIYNKINVNLENEIVELGEKHLDDLLGLVKIVYPEYFKKKTVNLGRYYGIYHKNQLVAVTGERMQMNEFIEVSAVITHPEHTGKGYAKQLVAHTTNIILNQNKIPFLHVSEKNIGAVKLYENLGFQLRRKISIWTISK